LVGGGCSEVLVLEMDTPFNGMMRVSADPSI